MLKRQEMRGLMMMMRLYPMVLMVMMVMMAIQWQVGSSHKITVNPDGGYEDVLVAIGKDLDQSKCQDYVNNIKAMINNGSTLLYSATEDKLFFFNVTILIPEEWTDCGGEIIDQDPVFNATFEEAHIRVQQTHPFFLDNPWTQQPRGCGEEGDFIYFSDTYLADKASDVGSQSIVFVHEWAKFRWGVFEEYGHAGDGIFPSAYRDINAEWQPNYCTDGSVNGTMTNCTAETSEAECSFVPNPEQSTNITSSLLAVPFVDSVNTFCDENNHNTIVPTKHNFMCDKNSTWNIISQHADFNNTDPVGIKGNTTYTIQSTAASLTQERLVFLLDVTRVIPSDRLRWDYVRDTVRQFIKVKAAYGSQVGFITFDTDLHESHGLVTLDSNETREALAGKVPMICNCSKSGKDIGQTIKKAVEMLGTSGKIILITNNMNLYTVDTKMDLVTRAAGLALQPILYPSKLDIPTDVYELVAEFSGLMPMIVNSTEHKYHPIENYVTLSKYVEKAGRDTLTEVNSGNCTANGCTIELTVLNVADYESNFFIETLLDTEVSADTITLEVKDPGGNEMLNKTTIESISSYIFWGSEIEHGNYTVTIRTSDGSEATVFASLVAFSKSLSYPYRLAVSASKSLSDLAYTMDPPTAPIIYATLTDGTQSIVFAEVTATIRNVISSTESVNSITLHLNDKGVGGDVTGNDGIYSAYLVGVPEVGQVTISISANDNNGTARIVRTTTTAVNPLDDVLVETGTFFVTSASGINGQATGEITPDYPPCRVTDLHATRAGDNVTLSFTAVGEHYDVGRATSYTLIYDQTKELNISAEAGIIIFTSVVLDNCGTVYTFTVTAVDSAVLKSQPSNEVRVIYPCTSSTPSPSPPSSSPLSPSSPPPLSPSPSPLSTSPSPPSTKPPSPPPPLPPGVIVGIVIGSLLFIIIIIVIVYLCLNSDHLNDLILWQILTCHCIKKNGKTKKNMMSNNVVRGTSSGPIQMTREIYGDAKIYGSTARTPNYGIEDLYAKPDLASKWNAHKEYDNYSYTDSDSGEYPSQQYESMDNKPVLPPLKPRINIRI